MTMLTSSQIEAARYELEFAVRDIGDDEPELAQEKANAVTALAALDAYSRVAWLLELTSSQIESALAGAWAHQPKGDHMKLDDLTVGEARELTRLFGGTPLASHPYDVGKPYLMRTVTMILTGRLVEVHAQELVLEDAAWIADTERWWDTLSTGMLREVEPFPEGRVIVGRGAIIDACVWGHELPRSQK